MEFEIKGKIFVLRAERGRGQRFSQEKAKRVNLGAKNWNLMGLWEKLQVEFYFITEKVAKSVKDVKQIIVKK